MVRSIQTRLREVADPTRAPQMQAYMKSSMRYLGVASPVHKSHLQGGVARASARVLRRVDQRRAGAVARRQVSRGAIRGDRGDRRATVRSFNTFAAMSMHEEMIVTGAWWDYVDTIAGHQVGDVLRAEPRRMKPLMRRWARDANMWKRRTAILSQLGFKPDTDLEASSTPCIEPNLADR
jgi:3-methyladenine DNA glycosylase AlkD